MKNLLSLIITLLVITNFLFSQSTKSQYSKEDTALILIDIQNFYFPGGALPLFEPEKAALNAQKLLYKFRNRNMTIIHVRHNAKEGAEIHDLVSPNNEEKIISKSKVNSFSDTDLLEYLHKNNIRNLIICGMQTHMCVEAVTRAASDYGFNCTLIEDACATRNLQYGNIIVQAKDVHNSTLGTLNGTYAKITTTEKYLNSTNNISQ